MSKFWNRKSLFVDRLITPNYIACKELDHKFDPYKQYKKLEVNYKNKKFISIISFSYITFYYSKYIFYFL